MRRAGILLIPLCLMPQAESAIDRVFMPAKAIYKATEYETRIASTIPLNRRLVAEGLMKHFWIYEWLEKYLVT